MRWLIAVCTSAVLGSSAVLAAEIVEVSRGCVVLSRASLDVPARELAWSGKTIVLSPGESVKCRNRGEMVVVTGDERLTVDSKDWFLASVVLTEKDRATTRREELRRTGTRGSGRPLPPEALSGEGFDPGQSAGVFVGVGRFEDEEFAAIAYAVDDAVDLAHVFSIELGLIAPSRVVVAIAGEPQKGRSSARLEQLREAGATIEAATRTRILSSIRRKAREAGTGGVLIVALATHGFTDAGSDVLVAADSDRELIADTGVALPQLLGMVGEAATPRRLVLLDACRETLIQGRRSAGADSASAMSRSFHDAITAASGQAVLSAATQGGYAYDDGENGNGVFTSAILSGLQGSAEGDSRGYITVSNLARYVSRSVQDWVKLNKPESPSTAQGITMNLEGTMVEMPLAMQTGSFLVTRAIELFDTTASGTGRTEAVSILSQQAPHDATAAMWLAYAYELGIGGLGKDQERAERLAEETLGEAQRLAEEGNAAARAALGHAYSLGIGVKVDHADAIRWYQLAAEDGSAYSMHRLGALYKWSDVENIKDLKKAVRWFRKGAEQGQPDAAHQLALAYMTGEGVPTDPTEEARWTRVAAERGQLTAMFNLGKSYSDGDGVVQDYDEARVWYERAATEGHIGSMNNLGWIHDGGRGVPRDAARATDWWRKAAESGNDRAMYNLALKYRAGDGVERDDREAARWYRAAAELGHLDSIGNLGLLYSQGEGVEQSETQAIGYWRQAAEQGHLFSLYHLARRYEIGEGVDKDEVAAVALYHRCAEGAYRDALYRLAMMYSQGRGVVESDESALELHRRAAEAGHRSSSFSLGWMYEKGEGTERDMRQAAEWYRKAAEAGDIAAMNNLGILYKRGSGTLSKDLDQARFWYEQAAGKGNDLAMFNLGLLLEEGDEIPAALEWYRKAAAQGHKEARVKVDKLESER